MSSSKVTSFLSWIILLILVIIPFHAFLTVYLASLVGHYTLLRLWKEFLLVILVCGSILVLYQDGNLRRQFFRSRLTKLILIYCVLSLVWGIGAYLLGKVTLKALGYGLIVNLRFLVFFLVVRVVAARSPKVRGPWPKLLLVPAAVVIAIGLLQRLVLPYDFLKHFGYSASTIYPYETINHDIHFPRVMSTLRGANPLGAYMVLILTSATALFSKAKKYRWALAFFGAAGFLVLIFSYSRGAWIGALVSLFFLSWISLKKSRTRKLVLACFMGLLVIGGVLAIALRNNSSFENIFLHTQRGSSIKATSDQAHTSAFRSGLHDVLHEPLGRGVGTAGPASVYNAGKTRIAENYFIQIGQELGWVGLALFLAINYSMGRELWFQRSKVLAVGLLASLVGLSIVNLLSHGWADDTLAYLWWGLAGTVVV